jgi:hypothetical protein
MKPLLLQEVVHLILEDLEQGDQVLESVDSCLDHQVVNCFRVLETGPHDSLELKTSVDKGLGILPENIGEKPAIVDDVKVDPVPLSINPDLQVLVH